MFWNDDFFLTQDVNALSYPNYYNTSFYSSMEGRFKKNGMDPYVREMTNTYNLFEDKTILHYDIHCPIIYNKEHFELIVASENWKIRDGYVIKSLYANSIPVKGVHMDDCKINYPLTYDGIQNKIEDRHIFSIGDKGINQAMLNILGELYPDKSKYEL
jgi:hypothetical protein